MAYGQIDPAAAWMATRADTDGTEIPPRDIEEERESQAAAPSVQQAFFSRDPTEGASACQSTDDGHGRGRRS